MAEQQSNIVINGHQKDVNILAENGLLYGVGNEVWIGLFGILVFIWATKYFLDAFIFPIDSNNTESGNGQSAQNNQGQYNSGLSQYTHITLNQSYLSDQYKYLFFFVQFRSNASFRRPLRLFNLFR